ncbi:MAG: MFS transporter [Dehalococcoidia bacterium]
MTATTARMTASRLPRSVWILGVVSLLMDTSSELTHSLLPMLMTTTLGAGVFAVGLVEGIAEATAAVVKVASGAVSDRWRRRKPLVVIGYGLAAVSKPAFPLATSVGAVLAARCADRLGKGIRGAPRDALVADVTPPHQRATAFGLRQALDSVGAVLGPSLAIVLMGWLAGDLRLVLWWAVVPALLAVGLLVVGVEEPPTPARAPATPRPRLTGAAALPARLWRVVGIAVLFTLARFSEAFLVLRAASVGLPAAQVPLVMVTMSAVFAAGAYPAGVAADRLGGRGLLLGGLAVLAVADVVLARATTPAQVLIGAAGWGLHLALTQGLFSALVAAAAPAALRATAFGVYGLATGAALLAASALAGALWHQAGAAATFYAGAGFAFVTMLAVLALGDARTGAAVS